MRKVTLPAIAILASIVLHAQPLFSKDQQKIQQAVVKMFEALSGRDSAALKTYCTPDITLYEYGLVWNIDTLIRKGITLNQAADFRRTNTFDFIHIETDKSTAWVTYRLNSAITREGRQTMIQWLETVVLVKIKKQWRVKHLHSTLIKRS
ncbi:MAG: nuclear transport factor 2 family protein [Chitinophagaceae bacterium]|nr:nuclear transport factor 2 family protein [Chitinophagaceae bacterium]